MDLLILLPNVGSLHRDNWGKSTYLFLAFLALVLVYLVFIHLTSTHFSVNTLFVFRVQYFTFITSLPPLLCFQGIFFSATVIHFLFSTAILSLATHSFDCSLFALTLFHFSSYLSADFSLIIYHLYVLTLGNQSRARNLNLRWLHMYKLKSIIKTKANIFMNYYAWFSKLNMSQADRDLNVHFKKQLDASSVDDESCTSFQMAELLSAIKKTKSKGTTSLDNILISFLNPLVLWPSRNCYRYWTHLFLLLTVHKSGGLPSSFHYWNLGNVLVKLYLFVPSVLHPVFLDSWRNFFLIKITTLWR